jgi:hypothetical protein
MPETNESRLDVQVGSRHLNGRPYHFPSLTQDERIRRIFGLPEDAPLPLVRQETLAVYFDHLMAQLSLPFEALYCQNGGEMRQLINYVHVMELVDPRRSRNHSLNGLLCKAKNHKDYLELPLAEFGVQEDNPNCQLIDDYAYWFVNCR